MASGESRLETLFHRAADLSAEEIGPFLDEHCAGDPELRDQLERILRSDTDAADGFMQTAARAGEAASGLSVDCAGVRIGRYTLVRKIGEGGMGIVYEARQENPARTVALKVIRPGMASPGILKRFTHEAQVLGQLQHPGIACIYEAGIAEVSGKGLVVSGGAQRAPYFAMELVQGQPLTEYTAARNLGTRERLELFASICDAVQHAHQKGIIHRDLKPGNILVVDQEATEPRSHGATKREEADGSSLRGFVAPWLRGFPKVLDFGIARLTDSDVQTLTIQTDVGQLIGTVPYMSPEQVVGDSRQLDIRSDVYALGVILYELLTGRLPLDLKNRSIPEATRMIREDEPSRLSSFNARFRGDLDTIVSKALEKDRERRYASAGELADDVRRYLRVEPILARPTSAAYRIQKFARRNKILVSAIVVVFVVLVAGVIGTSIGLARAVAARDAESRERQRADAEARVSRAVTEFLTQDLLAAVAPEEQGKDVSMRQVMDEAAKRVEDKFKDQPDVESAIRVTLGETYLRLGLLDAADGQLTKAHQVRLASVGPASTDTRAAARWLAHLRILQSRYEEAERELRALMEQDCEGAGRQDEGCMTDLHHMADILVKRGRMDEAERMHGRLLERKRRVLGEENESTLLTAGELGSLLVRMGRLKEAAPVVEQTLSGQRKVLGPEHPHTLFTLKNLAVLKQRMGELDKAESLFNELLEAMKRVFGPESPYTLYVSGDLFPLYEQQGRLADAERLGSATREALARLLGPDHVEVLITMEKLAHVHMSQERWADAESIYAEVVERGRRSDPTHVFAYLRMQAGALIKLSRYEEAEGRLLESVQLSSTDPQSPVPPKTIRKMVELYEAWGKPEPAAEWRAKLPSEKDAASRPG